MDFVQVEDEQPRKDAIDALKAKYPLGVTDWRAYAKDYMAMLVNCKTVGIRNNICMGAIPTVVESEPVAIRFLPVEFVRADHMYGSGVLEYIQVCYERVDAVDGTIWTPEGLRWPKDTTGAKVTFSNLQAERQCCLGDLDDPIQSVLANIRLSRCIEKKSDRCAYLFYTITHASLLLPFDLLQKYQAEGIQIDRSTEWTDPMERFVFLFLFLLIDPKAHVPTPDAKFYTACVRYRNILEHWNTSRSIEPLHAMAVKALLELEMAGDQPPKGGLLYYRVSNIQFFMIDAFQDLVASEAFSSDLQEIEKRLEDSEYQPLAPEYSEHRANNEIVIGSSVYKQGVTHATLGKRIDGRRLGLQACITGRPVCFSSFNNKPARFVMRDGSVRMLGIDAGLILQVIAWVAAQNPVYRLAVPEKPHSGREVSDMTVMNAMNFGLLGDHAVEWIWEQILYGNLKISSKSKNGLFKLVSSDEEGLVINSQSSPLLTNRFAAAVTASDTYLLLGREHYVRLSMHSQYWRASNIVSGIERVKALGKFRSGRPVR